MASACSRDRWDRTDLGATALDEIEQGLQSAAGVGRQRDRAVALGGCVQRPGSCRRDGHVRPRAQQLHYLRTCQSSSILIGGLNHSTPLCFLAKWHACMP